MNILVTGSGGFIASEFIKLLEEKYTVYKMFNGERYSIEKDIIVLNLLNIDHIKLLNKESIKIDVVVHTASRMVSELNTKDMSILYDNIKMYENLILIINRFKPKKVVNLSSTAVYPNNDGEYYEYSEINPSVNNDGLYGLSKFCGENLLNMSCQGVKIISLRISQVYADSMRNDRLFEVMKNELKETNKITVCGTGERVSNFIDIKLLSEKILFFVEQDVCGLFNVGDKNLSYEQVAKLIIDKHGNYNSIINLIDKGLSSKTYININKLKEVEADYAKK